MENLSDLIGIEKAIYVIEQTKGDCDETFQNFVRFKQSTTRKCARSNSPSLTLYVGSSTTNLRKRISEHMGDGNKATYALHLSHWFNGEYKVTVKVYECSAEVLQIIEDALSDKLKPAFGKQGGNNR